MRFRAAFPTVFILVALGSAGTARADTVVAPFAGNWSTTLTYQGASIPGTVRLTSIDASSGASALQAIGGHLCGAPTSYYHGDFTDMPSSSMTQTGTMTLCTATTGHALGRWSGGGDEGNIDITLNPAQTGFDGSFTDDTYGTTQGYGGRFVSHFPGDGCCSAGGGGAPGGWVIGGGVELYPPTALCRVQRGFPEASDARAGLGPGAEPVDRCVEGKLLDHREKSDLRQDAKATLLYVLAFCGAAGQRGGLPVLKANLALDLCRVAVELYLETATKLVHDPPDRHFALPPGAAVPMPLPRSMATDCPSRLTRALCAAVRGALSHYLATLDVLNSIAGDIATGANRTASAVAASEPLPAFFQEAFAKVNEGAMAEDAAALQTYGKTLASVLQANHLDVAVSPGQAKGYLITHRPSGVSESQLRALLGQLSSLSRHKLSGALRSPIRAPTFAASYRSISLMDLAAIVNGLASTGSLSVAAGRQLAADLTSARSVCTNSSRRTTAMRHFIADARRAAPSDAQFLSFGAQPLLANSVPASC